ncbi:hypothetical protein [Acetobacterium tundrae]|uniref:Uncharacterized protein n=1 Tax=Acetobacterium tundrae TaxID=132932 RepID=A0ABR6WNW8_9FIRM|nr:hypothetical protein [Acetobacterium tundrae]MBC3798034.1 hypothetical protein [Acetobacterium tundrae]
MAGYIAGRPCIFRGIKYLIGDLIPFEAVDPRRERALIDSGHINKNPDAMISGEALQLMSVSAAELKIDITISKSGDGSKTAVFLTPEEINLVFQAWVENADIANGIVAGITNLDVLAAIKSRETRKGVTDAIDKKIAELTPAPVEVAAPKEGGEVGEA